MFYHNKGFFDSSNANFLEKMSKVIHLFLLMRHICPFLWITSNH